MEQCLRQYVDLCGQPRKSLLKLFAHYAKDEQEKKTLTELSDEQSKACVQLWPSVCCANGLQEPYNRFVKEELRSTLEILLAFPSVSIPFDHFIEAAPRLSPRYYSISSSMKVPRLPRFHVPPDHCASNTPVLCILRWCLCSSPPLRRGYTRACARIG